MARLEELRHQIATEQETAREMGLSPTGFAVYGLLEQYRPGEVAESAATYNAANRDLASLIDESIQPFTAMVDWWQKEDLQREMRQKIKRQLRASGLDGTHIEKLAGDIVDLAKVRVDR
jgi:type I restriction enzyme, R subunit